MANVAAVPGIITSSLLVLILLPSTAVADWSHVEQSDGVDIYERSPRYMGEQRLRAVVEVDAPIGQVVTVFTDPDERRDWTHRVADQEVLQVDGDQEDAWMERYWTRIDMPFPVSDRDYVVAKAYELHPEERQLTARVQSIVDDRKPEKGCCVRAVSIMQYNIEAIPDSERTRVELIIETDLKGNLSRGRLVRDNASDWPVATLRSLADRAESADVTIDERVSDWHD